MIESEFCCLLFSVVYLVCHNYSCSKIPNSESKTVYPSKDHVTTSDIPYFDSVFNSSHSSFRQDSNDVYRDSANFKERMNIAGRPPRSVNNNPAVAEKLKGETVNKNKRKSSKLKDGQGIAAGQKQDLNPNRVTSIKSTVPGTSSVKKINSFKSLSEAKKITKNNGS